MKLSLISIFLLSLSALIVTGSPILNDGNGRILADGSDQCTSGQFPYLVSVKVNSQHKCGGWIYNERFVVTSFECVQGFAPATLSVTVGELALNLESIYKINYLVQSITLYTEDGGFNPVTGRHNIALIELVNSIDFANPLADVLYYDEHAPAQPATIAGWGESILGGQQSLRCRTTDITIATDVQCKSGAGELYDPVYQLCATQQQEANACEGDQGGPVMQTINGEYVISAMIAKVVGGCQPYTSVGMVRLASYYSWFTRTAGRQPSPSDLKAAKSQPFNPSK